MAISAHLHGLFYPSFVHAYPEAMIEIAHGPPDEGPRTGRLFSAFDPGRVVEFCEAQSRAGHNVYVAPVLMTGPAAGGNGRCTEANFLAAMHAWADADENYERVVGILRTHALVPAMALLTATVPERRMQLYFRLAEPVTAGQLRTANKALAALLGTDNVASPTHLMRVCGTINYPTAAKAARGRAPEVVGFNLPLMPPGATGTGVSAIVPTVTLSWLLELAKLGPDLDGTRAWTGGAAPGSDPYIDFAAAAGSRQGRDDEALSALLEGSRLPHKWHNSIRDAIATMVGRGWEEAAIRLACAPYCRDGAADKDLDPLINGAVGKWGRADTGRTAGAEYSREGGAAAGRQASNDDDLYEVNWHDATAEVPLQPWLVEGLLPQTGTGLMSGQSGTGKSYVALDLAGSVASGLPFARNDVVRRGGVLYIAAEDRKSVV